VLEAVMQIREILVRIRIRESVPLTMDPDPVPAVDPAIFVIQELSFSVYCFLLVFLNPFSRIKSLTSHKTDPDPQHWLEGTLSRTNG
jgi:hypothetical protein